MDDAGIVGFDFDCRDPGILGEDVGENGVAVGNVSFCGEGVSFQHADFDMQQEAATQTGDDKVATNEAAYNLLHTDLDGANLKQVAFSIGDQFKPVLGNVMAGKGLDGISTTGEAFDEIDKGVKTVLGAALYEALENNVDITNDRIFKRYIKKITPKLMETRSGLRAKWAANQEVKKRRLSQGKDKSNVPAQPKQKMYALHRMESYDGPEDLKPGGPIKFDVNNNDDSD